MTAIAEETYQHMVHPHVEPMMAPVSVEGQVAVNGAVRTREDAADFGAYLSITIPATAFNTQILPYDENRKIAWISVLGLAAGGVVYIGSQAQVQANPPQGFQLNNADQPFPVSHKQPLYVASDGTHGGTLSIAIERWESELERRQD